MSRIGKHGMDVWSLLDRISTVITTLAAALTVFLTIRVSNNQDRVALLGQLENAIVVYTDKYDNLVRARPPNPFVVREYVTLRSFEKNSSQIAAGLLVTVVDLMYESGDNRAATWSKAIGGFSGPLFCKYQLDIYAREPETKAAINAARIRASSEAVQEKVKLSDCEKKDDNK